MKLTYESAIDKYIALRDKVSAIQKEADIKKAELTKIMVDLENWVTQHAKDDGLENVKTEYGTGYWSTKHSATLADPAAFFDYVLANKRWDLLEKRVSKAAVKAEVEDTGELPPGVNYSRRQSFNVKRARNLEDAA